MATNYGDSDFSEGVRNPSNLVGSVPNMTDCVSDKYIKIAEQRDRILESFIAEHAGILPSQIRQVTTPLDNGDVTWHLEII